MTAASESFAIFVIGTGRGGASLAARALETLGLEAPDGPDHANETDLSGAGEPVATRDRMRALARAPDVLQGLRVSGWRASAAARETVDWAAAHMAARRDAAGGRGLVVRVPLSALFLPLWIDAAERIGLDLRFVWATRGAAAGPRAPAEAHDRPAAAAAPAIHALRSFYILRDAPAETLLLPHDGWAEAPEAQIEALARLAGVADPARRDAARAACSGVPDQSAPEEAADPPEPLRRLDAVIGGKRGPLGAILAPGAVERARLMVSLADLVHDLHPKGRPFHARDALDARLALLARLAAEAEQETPEMKDELEILARRIRDVSHENHELTRRVPDSMELEAELRKARAEAQASAQKLEEVSARLDEARAERDRLAEEVGALRERARAADAELDDVKAAYAALTREREAIEEAVSARWAHESHTLQRKNARLQKRLDRLKGPNANKRLQVKLTLRDQQMKRLTRLGGLAALFGSPRSERRRIEAVAASPHFDAAWYLKTYPDVRKAKMSPARHFVLHGVYEGRSPSPDLDTLDYYIRHPKALAEGINPVLHKDKRS
ncbi:hypothetical protein [Pikeienuella sp. HZG-20]|uniref:hypothetical protein n=1 Tax=Paludibacillus litoralis TaxID=3133267 RepID=UPI0030EF17EB